METEIKKDHPLYKEFRFRKTIVEREFYLKQTITIGSKFYSDRFKKDRIVTKMSDSNVWLDGVRHSWKAMERTIRNKQLQFIWIA